MAGLGDKKFLFEYEEKTKKILCMAVIKANYALTGSSVGVIKLEVIIDYILLF